MVRRKSHESVEMNVAAMLDMAFQLLSFFIMTFRPPPPEGMIFMKMPPPQPVVGMEGGQKAGEDDKIDPNTVKPMKTLVITLASNNGRDIDHMQVGTDEVKPPDLKRLTIAAQALLNQPGTPFEQVILQASPNLPYFKLIEVVDECSRLTVTGEGEEKKSLSKLSFVALPEQQR